METEDKLRVSVVSEGGGPRRRCLLCSDEFIAMRKSGKPQAFCCEDHRREYHRIQRRWAALLIEEGRVTIADMRDELSNAHVGPANADVGADEDVASDS